MVTQIATRKYLFLDQNVHNVQPAGNCFALYGNTVRESVKNIDGRFYDHPQSVVIFFYFVLT